MELIEHLELINTKIDFISFLEAMQVDYHDNIQEWENDTLESFLEAFTAIVEDLEGFYLNNHLEQPNNIDWKFIAKLLYTAKIYE